MIEWRVPGGAVRGETTLEDALRSLLSSRGLTPVADLGAIARVWTAVVGPEVAAHVVPWRIDADELVVAVDDPAWATEIGFLSEEVLDGLAQHLEFPVPSRLKAHVKLSFGLD